MKYLEGWAQALSGVSNAQGGRNSSHVGRAQALGLQTLPGWTQGLGGHQGEGPEQTTCVPAGGYSALISAYCP